MARIISSARRQTPWQVPRNSPHVQIEQPPVPSLPLLTIPGRRDGLHLHHSGSELLGAKVRAHDSARPEMALSVQVRLLEEPNHDAMTVHCRSTGSDDKGSLLATCLQHIE